MGSPHPWLKPKCPLPPLCTLLSAPARSLAGLSSQEWAPAVVHQVDSKVTGGSNLSPRALKPQPPCSVSRAGKEPVRCNGLRVPAPAPSLAPSNLDKSNVGKHSSAFLSSEESGHQISGTVCQRYPLNAGRRRQSIHLSGRKEGHSAPPPPPHALGLPGSFQHSLSLFIQSHLGQQNLGCGLFPTGRNTPRRGQGEQNTRFFWGAGRWLTGQAAGNPTAAADEPHAV